MEWNDRIKRLRKESGLTLKEIAERLKVTESTAQRYENSIKYIPFEVLVAYSKIFNCSPSYIMGWENEGEAVLADADFSPEEIALIGAFRKADKIDRESVRRTLGISGRK